MNSKEQLQKLCDLLGIDTDLAGKKEITCERILLLVEQCVLDEI
ncbi:MAG: hypothetical protein WC356_03705 [Candidatus Micrarchaeia archaeon]|jgi:hypothetical protein